MFNEKPSDILNDIEKIQKQRKEIQESTKEIERIMNQFAKDQDELTKKYGW